MAIPQLAYQLTHVFDRQIPKFGIQGSEYRLTFASIPDGVAYPTVLDMIHDALDSKYLWLL